jgi:cyclopropane-fatty-acyl-phospholipid synthase
VAAAKGQTAIGWVEQGRVPDRVVRLGIRRLLRERLDEVGDRDPERAAEIARAFFASMRQAPVALVPEKPNEQHYEVPAPFFARVLGPHRKYSGCLWGEGVTTLAEAEAGALATTCERAGLADGQHVLELGAAGAR